MLPQDVHDIITQFVGIEKGLQTLRKFIEEYLLRLITTYDNIRTRRALERLRQTVIPVESVFTRKMIMHAELRWTTNGYDCFKTRRKIIKRDWHLERGKHLLNKMKRVAPIKIKYNVHELAASGMFNVWEDTLKCFNDALDNMEAVVAVCVDDMLCDFVEGHENLSDLHPPEDPRKKRKWTNAI